MKNKKRSFRKQLFFGSMGLMVILQLLVYTGSMVIMIRSGCSRQLMAEQAGFRLMGGQFRQQLDIYEDYLYQIAESERLRQTVTQSFSDTDYQQIYRNNQIMGQEITGMLGEISYLSGFLVVGENGYNYEYSPHYQGAFVNSDESFVNLLELFAQHNPAWQGNNPMFYFPESFSVFDSLSARLQEDLDRGQIIYMNMLETSEGKPYALVIMGIKQSIFREIFGPLSKQKELYLMDAEGNLGWTNSDQTEEELRNRSVLDPNRLEGRVDWGKNGVMLESGSYIFSNNFVLKSRISVSDTVPYCKKITVGFMGILALSLLLYGGMAPAYLRNQLLPLEHLMDEIEQKVNGTRAEGAAEKGERKNSRMLTSKVMRFLCVSGVLPVACFMVFLSVFLYRGVFDNITETDVLALKQISRNIDKKLEMYNEISKSISYMEEVQELFAGKRSNADEVDELMKRNRTFRQDVISLSFYARNKKRLYSDNAFYNGSHLLENTIWKTSNGKVEYFPYEEQNMGQNQIWIARKVYDSTPGSIHTQAGYTAMLVDMDSIFTTLENGWPDSSGFYFLQTEFGLLYPNGESTSLLFANREKLEACLEEGKSVVRLTLDKKPYILFTQYIQEGRVQVAGLLPVSVITQQVIPVLYQICLFLLLFLLFVIFASSQAAKQMLRPMTRLCEELDAAVSAGETIRRVQTGVEEVDFLSEHFSGMLIRTQQLVDENYQSKMREKELLILEKEAQLDALQQQINPHFLYNTLDSIKWTAYSAGIDEIVEMATSLGKLLRWGIRKTPGLIPLAHEMEYLENYVHIQKLRYGDKFEFFLHMEESAQTCYCPKLMLQPVVENAIIHGIEEMEQGGEIYVRCFARNEVLCCVVKDNGRGMDKDKLDRLVNTMESGDQKGTSHIGLANVYSRLKLQFGSEFVMDVKSIQQKGTKITIVIPKVEKEAAE